MSTKTQDVPAPVVSLSKDVPQKSLAPVTHKELMDYLGRVEMNAQTAAIAFAFAKNHCQFLRGNAQVSVNLDFKAEIPNALAGLDVDGSKVKLSVATREGWDKLGKGLDRAIKIAETYIPSSKQIEQK